MAKPEENGSAARLREAIEVLEAVVRDRGLLGDLPLEDRHRLLAAAGDVFNPDVVQRRRRGKALRKREKAAKQERDERVLAETGIRLLRDKPVFTTPNVFAPDDFEQREVDDAERPRGDRPAALLRVQAALRRDPSLLRPALPVVRRLQLRQAHRDRRPRGPGRAAHRRSGEDRLPGRDQAAAGRRALIVTTRFPRDAAPGTRRRPTSTSGATGSRSSASTCGTRRASRRSAAHLNETRDRLDFIVNNACQTVRRPPDFYRHMMELETAAEHAAGRARGCSARRGLRARTAPPGRAAERCDGAPAPPSCRRCRSCPRTSSGQGELFPEGRLDQDLQQVDLRERNSWRLTLAEVSSVELLETQLVNAVAPFVLNARLKPLMLRTPERDKHIVNVSAVEGQFYRRFKTTRHPHTNMAKAALNMMTRTSAADYHADGIHMNSVDTGWVSDEDPVHIADAEDGGARLPPAARHRRRRRADRRPDHRRLQHRRPRVGPVPEGLPADRLVELVGLRGHDEVVAVEALDLVRPPADRRPAPLGQQRGVVAFSFRGLTDRSRELQRLREVVERKTRRSRFIPSSSTSSHSGTAAGARRSRRP